MAAMERRLLEIWYRPRGGVSLLQPLGWAYGAAMRLRQAAYAHGALPIYRIGKPLVVVGNLTIGGTGKTPLTIWLAEALKARGLAVGIVSRGYRRAAQRGRPTASLLAQGSRWEEVGDEPLLIQHRTGCPVVVGEDRVAAALRLAAEPVDLILSDDGLQHLRLARDCEIAVLDGARGLGNGRLIPAGPLRESPVRLKQVDAVVINGAADHASLARGGPVPLDTSLCMSLRLGAAQRLEDGSSVPLERFRSAPLHAVAGIGHPERFFRDLRAQGLQVIEHPFPDHHPFSSRELDFPDEWPILMTQKDAIRCAALATSRMWLVPVTATFADAQARALLDLVSRRIDAARALKG